MQLIDVIKKYPNRPLLVKRLHSETTIYINKYEDHWGIWNVKGQLSQQDEEASDWEILDLDLIGKIRQSS